MLKSESRALIVERIDEKESDMRGLSVGRFSAKQLLLTLAATALFVLAFPMAAQAQISCGGGDQVCHEFYCCPAAKSCDETLPPASCGGGQISCGTYCCPSGGTCRVPAPMCGEVTEFDLNPGWGMFPGIDTTRPWVAELQRPLISSAVFLPSPLNSELSKVHVTINPNGNVAGLDYCLWDMTTNRFAEQGSDGRWYLANNACTGDVDTQCCVWQQHSVYGGSGGFDLFTEDNSALRLRVKVRQGSFTAISDSSYSVLTSDRTPPSVPGPVTLTPVDTGQHHMSISWPASTDFDSQGGRPCNTVSDCPSGLNTACSLIGNQKLCVNASGGACNSFSDCPTGYDTCESVAGKNYCLQRVDYFVLRGRGSANGVLSQLGPSVAPPADHRPVKGEWDSFEDSYTVGGVMGSALVTPAGSFTKTGGKLAASCASPSCRVSFNGLSGAAYDFSGGYVLTFDVRKIAGGSQNGVEAIFKFKNHYVRWAIGEYSGGQNWSKFYWSTSAGDDTFPVAFSLAQNVWHQAMVYVKGNDVRGFIDGVPYWTLNRASITGDPIADAGGKEGFRVVNELAGSGPTNSAEIDNYLIAPFLTSSGVPVTSWTDTDATDFDSPITATFSNSLAVAAGPTRIDLTLPIPASSTSFPNDPATLDRGTAYIFTAVGVDRQGNMSNMLQAPGFEPRNISAWQQGAPSDSLTRSFTVSYDGFAAGYANLTSAVDFGVQKITTAAPFGSVLFFSRYFRFQDWASGIVYPAAIEPTSPAMAWSGGTSYGVADTLWRRAVTFYPTTGYLTQAVNQYKVYSRSANSPSTKIYLDQNRLDVFAMETTNPMGFHHTRVEYLVEGGSPCNNSDFNLLGDFNHTGLTPRSASDTSGDLSPNKLRSYRIRSCDTNSYCGDPRGGLSCDNASPTCQNGSPCTPDQWCQEQYKAGQTTFTSCKDFSGQKYCVRANQCMPGVELFTNAAVMQTGPVARILTTLESVNENILQTEGLKVSFDADYSTNRIGTEYLVAMWNALDAPSCGLGEPFGFVRSDKYVGLFQESSWQATRTRSVAGLFQSTYYCFRAMARNGDKISTGQVDGPYTTAAGWSPLSAPIQTASPPYVLAGSYAVKYGVQDGISQQRAARIDGLPDQSTSGGQTIQELTFTVRDANSIGGSYPSVNYVAVRLSPHADFDHAGVMQRGFFVAEYDEGSGWTFREEQPSQFGNERVTLLLAPQSSAGWSGNDVVLTFKWKLQVGEPTYWAYQDYGAQILLEDLEGNFSDFVTNRFGACEDVFHTSYPPYAPNTLYYPPNSGWVNAGKAGVSGVVNFTAQSPVDPDHQYLTRLFSICDAFGVCDLWHLDDKPNWYNCVNDPNSPGDTVQFRITVHSGVVPATGLCDDTKRVLPATEQWDSVQTLYSAAQNREYYELTKPIDVTSLTEGKYYWCGRARDQHVYSEKGSSNTTLIPVGPTVTSMFGIDRQNPALTGFQVFALDPSAGESEITNKNGQWIFTPRLKFKWDPSTANLATESPIAGYKYIVIPGNPTDRVNPYDYAGGTAGVVTGSYPHDGRGSYVVSYYSAPYFPFGRSQFGVQSRDQAGNASGTTWFDVKLERKEIDGPCVLADPHVDQLEVYCNTDPGFDAGEEWNVGEPNAAKPTFTFIDPVMGNEARFDAHQNYCCDRRDPSTGQCIYYLAASPIESYSFTISRSLATVPDAAAEDDNKGTCEDPAPENEVCDQVCNEYSSCTDTDLIECYNNADCPSGQYCNDWFQCCPRNGACPEDIFHFAFRAGHPDDVATKLYHQVRYFLSYGKQLQPGTFYLTVKGWTDAGGETFPRRYRINVCGCQPDPNDPKPCKDATPRRRLGSEPGAMAYFRGGALRLSDGADGTVVVDPFYLDRTEVNRAQYQACVAENACTAIEGVVETAELSEENSVKPMVQVPWDAAEAYCSWAARRLPSEAEWAFAAKTVLGREPKDITGTRQTNDLYARGPAAVDKNYGPTPPEDFPIVNLFANVSEWLGEWWNAEPYAGEESPDSCIAECRSAVDEALAGEEEDLALARSSVQDEELLRFRTSETERCRVDCNRKLVRGGSFSQSVVDVDYRAGLDPAKGRSDVGFRCAMDAPTLAEGGQTPEKAASLPSVGNDISQLRP
ncbi:MAG: hypothetical protein C4523_00605 [Myxococcales bacterium]|nr:MAG: hypothetical protein C4523_00605 [Myxococcales bacterium]